MKTKIIYALVSSPNDYYYEQLFISVYSLRIHNKDAIVEIVCDKDTYNTLVDNRKNIFNYVNNVIAIDTPIGWTNVGKSRYIKTNIRHIITGDYLFIDTDTIIMQNLEEVDTWTMDIGATFDNHIEKPLDRNVKSESEKWIIELASKTGTDIGGLFHYNSGVFYVKDTKISHELYTRWYAKYLEFKEKGVNIDQLPLLVVNNDMGGVIRNIGETWNCQIIVPHGMNMIENAKIIHYFAQKNKYEIASPWVLEELKYKGEITDRIKRIVDYPQDSFKEKYRVIKGLEVDFIETPLYKIFCDYHNFYKLLVFESKIYSSIKSFLRHYVFIWKR